jgi:hypothetical protein
MGLFDTIHLKPPLACPTCGAEISEIQTHELGDSLSDYRIGSVIPFTPVLSGIVKETLWCRACQETDKPHHVPVYVVIWHSVLAGVDLDAEKAAARLASVDRLDLIGWIHQAQRQERKWRRRFYGLHNDVRKWHEHLAEKDQPEPEEPGEDPEAKNRRRSLRRLWGLEEEILNAADPLGSLIEKHEPPKEEAEEEDDALMFGW